MKYAWFEAPTFSRFTTAEEMRPNDIAMKLPDGRMFLVGTGGQLYGPSPWQRLMRWLRR
jgi:hypothetical protein